MPIRVKLRPDVMAAIREWNLSTKGRHTGGAGVISDPALINKLTNLSLPGEDINDTILRIINGTASLSHH